MPAKRMVGSDGTPAPPLPLSVASAPGTSLGNSGDAPAAGPRAARSCRCRMMVGSSGIVAAAARARARRTQFPCRHSHSTGLLIGCLPATGTGFGSWHGPI